MNRYNLGKIIKDLTNPMAIKPYYEDRCVIDSVQPPLGATAAMLRTGSMIAINKTNKELNKIGSLVANWTTRQRELIINMSNEEWFPFEKCFGRPPKVDENISDFMIKKIDTHYKLTKEEILKKNKDRSHILEVAFNLFEQENYIASIPLMLTQIDGMCYDQHGTFYFTSEKGIKKFPIMLQARMGEEENKDIYNLIKLIIDNSQRRFISERFSNIDDVNEFSILNRGAILHGHSKFLEYGNKINGYKVLSLLLYVNWMIDFIEKRD